MSEGYSIKFEMYPSPWQGAVIIFDDGQAKLNRYLLNPDRPVKILLEGLKPTFDQVEVAHHL